uniref:Uncharacterized protein n=1 Tax=Arundo donax TaxID=35708 RepID=A0A0A9E2H2_ARUDO
MASLFNMIGPEVCFWPVGASKECALKDILGLVAIADFGLLTSALAGLTFWPVDASKECALKDNLGLVAIADFGLLTSVPAGLLEGGPATVQLSRIISFDFVTSCRLLIVSETLADIASKAR